MMRMVAGGPPAPSLCSLFQVSRPSALTKGQPWQEWVAANQDLRKLHLCEGVAEHLVQQHPSSGPGRHVPAQLLLQPIASVCGSHGCFHSAPHPAVDPAADAGSFACSADTAGGDSQRLSLLLVSCRTRNILHQTFLLTLHFAKGSRVLLVLQL